MTRPHRRITAAATVAAVAALAACTPGSDAPQGDGTAAPGEVSTDVAAMGEQTLVVWDQEVRGGQNEQIERLNVAFMEQYPNVTIERNTQSTEDLEATLRLALTGEDAPDVSQVNNARAQMGEYVAAGQLRSLEPYAEAYGWEGRFPEAILQYSRYGEGAETFGEGSLYGMPQMGEVVGVYYSKAWLEAFDLQVPTTWAEFEEQLATITEAGDTPLMLGNLDQWPAIHVFGPIQGQTTPAEQIRDLGFGNPGASWTTPENLEAATTLQAWAEAGYFNDGFNGTDYDAAWQDFSQGEAPYLIAGSWLAADLADAMGDDVGFFAPPPAEEGGAVATTGATSIPFAITSASDNPDLGAAYIDFITSEEAMAIVAEAGNLPVVETAENAPDSGVMADLFNAFAQVSEEGELLPYLDWATPTMDVTIGQALQDLMAGQSTPEEFTEVLEADYGEFVGAE